MMHPSATPAETYGQQARLEIHAWMGNDAFTAPVVRVGAGTFWEQAMRPETTQTKYV